MHKSIIGEEREGGRDRKTDLPLRALYLKCLADMPSDSEVRGDDCIDRFYSQVISEKETESGLERQKLVMQKRHTVCADENQIKARIAVENAANFIIPSINSRIFVHSTKMSNSIWTRQFYIGFTIGLII